MKNLIYIFLLFAATVTAQIEVIQYNAGWNSSIYVVGEIQKPGKNIFRSILIGTTVVTFLYLLLNYVFLIVSPISDLKGEIEVGYISGLSLFGAEYANVQPHSGSQANTAVFHAFLKPGDKILGFDLSHGGHLTHGSPVNFSGRLYKAHFYGVEKETGRLDYENILKIAKEVSPKMIIAGASAYSREIDYSKFREIANQVGAFLLADISHPSWMIAAGLLSDPIPHCHVVTTTTHKTLRGPRGGLILMGKDFKNPFGEKLRSGELKKMSNLIDKVASIIIE